MAKKQRLLEKYEIPVEHLDFIYVKNCTDVREVERMLEILQSGEEGYYPELTKCTEQRLQDLDPNHRMLRTEIQCQRTTQQYDAELIVQLPTSSWYMPFVLPNTLPKFNLLISNRIIDFFRSAEN